MNSRPWRRMPAMSCSAVFALTETLGACPEVREHRPRAGLRLHPRPHPCDHVAHRVLVGEQHGGAHRDVDGPVRRVVEPAHRRGCQHPDDVPELARELDPPAEHARSAPVAYRPRDAGPHHAVALPRVEVGHEPAFGHLKARHVGERPRDAQHSRPLDVASPVAEPRVRLVPPRRPIDLRDLRLDGHDRVERERHHPAQPRHVVGPRGHDVGPERLELLHRLLAHDLAGRDHRDHRPDPHHDPHQRERAPPAHRGEPPGRLLRDARPAHPSPRPCREVAARRAASRSSPPSRRVRRCASARRSCFSPVWSLRTGVSP